MSENNRKHHLSEQEVREALRKANALTEQSLHTSDPNPQNDDTQKNIPDESYDQARQSDGYEETATKTPNEWANDSTTYEEEPKPTDISSGTDEVGAASGKKRKKGSNIWTFLGQSIGENKFLANYYKLLILMALCFVFNTYRQFQAINQVKKIDVLERKLKDIEYRALFKASEVTASSQKLNIENQVLKENLGLEPSTQPPYIIYGGKAPEENNED